MVFVVASEAISVGDTTVTLPGIGSYIALAIAQRDMAAIGLAIATMLIVILIYDQLLFRPLVAWADRFRFEQEAGILQPLSWVRTVLIRSRLVARAMAPLAAAWRWSYRLQPRLMAAKRGTPSNVSAGGTDGLWLAIVLILSGFALWKVWQFVFEGLSMSDVATATGLSAITMVRVVGLIAIASVIWVPIGVWVGMRPRIARLVQPVAQFMAAFPANLLFPVRSAMDRGVPSQPGHLAQPSDDSRSAVVHSFQCHRGCFGDSIELRYVGANLGVKGWLWWRKVALPGVFPYYVTGAITASGGSWNASIVAEVASWGDQRVQANGIGSYIAKATEAGNFHRIVLGIAVMSLFVVALNRSFWRPLYRYAERKFRLS
jgi:NitT/TauT family transport system permease protein